jgi:hypothetical protein
MGTLPSVELRIDIGIGGIRIERVVGAFLKPQEPLQQIHSGTLPQRKTNGESGSTKAAGVCLEGANQTTAAFVCRESRGVTINTIPHAARGPMRPTQP